jgi:alpha-tubulin suppressor-like RCC1 family protein
MSVNFTTIQLDGRQIDIDDLLVRRDLFSEGTLWTWGANSSGQLGTGNTTARSSPGTTIGSGINWKFAACSYEASIAIKTDGTLWTWGRNEYGQLGTGNTTSRSSPGTTAGGGTNWTQIAGSGSGYHNAAIKSDGTLWTWGFNNTGQLGLNNTSNYSSPVTVTNTGSNWKHIACGYYTSFGISTNGRLWTWGYNFNGQLGTGNTTNRSSPGTTAGGGINWKQVSSAQVHTAAIKTDGTLWVWGANDYGQLGTGNNSNYSSPVTTAGGGTNWKQVACGYTHTAAIKTDGTLWTCGYNVYGGLGTGNTTSRNSPGTTAGGGTNWKQVACGYNNTAAIKTDGTLWTCGYNLYEQLGDGTTTPRSSPGTTAGGGTNWKFVGKITSRFTIAGKDITLL